MTTSAFDVIVVGGGIASSSPGGVLARVGPGVLGVEKEAHFRDRIRGRHLAVWGVAEARQARLAGLLDAAGAVECSPSSDTRTGNRSRRSGIARPLTISPG